DFGWRRADQTRYELNGEQTVLPVELLSFTAKAVGDQVQLNWQTANEQNSDYFVIEHSTDARTFTLLGEVTAAGHSSTLLDYEMWDKQPVAGLNYYRLRQVDFDGTIHEHGLAVVRFAGDAGGPTVQVFPNPVADQATVYWTAEATDLWLFDINGRPVRQQPLNGEPGSLSLDMSDLPGGFYLLRLETPQGVETMRLVKR
ncbi:MAG: T9SS type A sorting domain-containing protein, partial [Lewinella sp.]|nr:T9SS type A sorting domain-containing protein [Lewinella sp.]